MTSIVLITLDQRVSLPLFFPVQHLVVLGCALLWGLGPGLLALLLGAAAGQLVFLPRGGPLAADPPESLLAVSGILIVGGLVATVAADRRRRGEELTRVQLELALTHAELTACETELERRYATDDHGI